MKDCGWQRVSPHVGKWGAVAECVWRERQVVARGGLCSATDEARADRPLVRVQRPWNAEKGQDYQSAELKIVPVSCETGAIAQLFENPLSLPRATSPK